MKGGMPEDLGGYVGGEKKKYRPRSKLKRGVKVIFLLEW